MFEWLSTIYLAQREFINGAASAVTLVGAVWAIRNYRKSKTRKLVYQWQREEKVQSDLPDGFSIKISLGEQEGTSLTTDFVTLLNKTNITLTEDDFVRPVQFEVDDTGIVFEAKVVDVGNGATGSLKRTQNMLTLSEFYIPRDTALNIYLAHDKSVAKRLLGTPKSIPDLEERTFSRPSDTGEAAVLAIAAFVVAITIVLSQIRRVLEVQAVSDALSLLPELLGLVLVMGTVLGVLFLCGVLVFGYFPRKIDSFFSSKSKIIAEEIRHSGTSGAAYIEKHLRP